MKKTVCDRCGIEIIDSKYMFWNAEANHLTDLCKKCFEDFKVFIANEPVVNKCQDCKYHDGYTMCSKHHLIMCENDYCSCWKAEEETNNA